MRRARAVPLALLAAAALACGPAPDTGPAEVAFDRDVCERCQMVISDRLHATQVRLEQERGAHLFDDLGCALLWLDARDATPREIWVRSPAGDAWIDGRTARYQAGRNTPMGYGLGPAADGISLTEARARVRAMEDERRSDPGQDALAR